MAIEQTFQAIKAAQQAGNFDTIGQLVSGAVAAGYDEAAFKRAYKEWERTGVSAEPNPLKQIAQGAQLGFTDEIVGFGSAVGKFAARDGSVRELFTDPAAAAGKFASDYEARRDAERASSALYQASNPGRSAALNVAGGLAVPVPGGFVAKGGTTAAKVGRAGLLGIPYGAAAGYGMAGEGDELKGAAVGGLLGGLTGAAAGAVVEGGAKAAGAAGRAIRGRGQPAIPAAPAVPAVETLAPDAVLPQVGPDAPIGQGSAQSADDAIIAAMLRDGYTPEQVRDALVQRALDTSPRAAPMTVADVVPAGGATQRLARGARTNAAGAAGRADAMLSARDRMQGRRIEETGAALLGSRMDDPELAMREITQRARDAARPLYQQVEGVGPVDISGLGAVEGSDAFQRAFRAVSGMPDMQGIGLDDPRFLDQMYKELGGMRQALSEAAKKSGNVNPRDIARIEMVMAPIRDALDGASGGTYSKALGAYSGEAQFNNALEAGLEVLKKPAAAVAREINGLPADQAQVYREAAMSAVRQRLRSMGYNRDAVKALFNSDEMVDKFSAILGPEKFKAFERAMLDEAKVVATSQMLRGNSQTVDKAADALNAGGYLDVLRGAVTDPQGTVTSGLLRAAVDRAGKAIPGAEARSDAILTRLLDTNSDSTIAWLNALIERQRQLQQQAALRGGILAPALPAGGILGGSAASATAQ